MIFGILLKTGRNEVLPYPLPASSPDALLGRGTTMRVIAKGWAPQQARACGFFFNHILCFTKIRAQCVCERVGWGGGGGSDDGITIMSLSI